MRVSEFEASEMIAIPSNEDGLLGTLIVSVERIAELMKVYHRSFQKSIVFSCVHGVFNLLGKYYNNPQTKIEQMIQESEIMTELGLPLNSGFFPGFN